ncbi:hypothetical protein LEP1GSC123_0570 [Leptospira borgpetersenii str. 200701203]|uniref:Uncharacterized protein n=1 Tax=Leptospira borgpetersenii str. 200701203 TaxID=1193007 RepID=M3FFZ2_LEPBO|nr:hypothetical protein LEP1GSC123_0570 [Leptospira borgpetersenii str. 200701203]
MKIRNEYNTIKCIQIIECFFLKNWNYKSGGLLGDVFLRCSSTQIKICQLII